MEIKEVRCFRHHCSGCRICPLFSVDRKIVRRSIENARTADRDIFTKLYERAPAYEPDEDSAQPTAPRPSATLREIYSPNESRMSLRQIIALKKSA
jgi:hypothetical protein